MNKKFGALSSSADPQKLSETVEGSLKIIGYILGSIATLQGVDAAIVNENINQIANVVVVLVPAFLVIKESGPVLFAAVRRILAIYFARFN